MPLDALEADTELAEAIGQYFVNSCVQYKRNEIERFQSYVTDWEFREYTTLRRPDRRHEPDDSDLSTSTVRRGARGPVPVPARIPVPGSEPRRTRGSGPSRA